jgi:exportin-2 (importin alpha re-exporter)
VSHSKVHDHEGFAILQSLILHLPSIHLSNYLKDVFIVIFTRLTKAKTQKLVKCIVIFFCYFVVKFGADELIARVDTIQPK